MIIYFFIVSNLQELMKNILYLVVITSEDRLFLNMRFSVITESKKTKTNQKTGWQGKGSNISDRLRKPKAGRLHKGKEHFVHAP